MTYKDKVVIITGGAKGIGKGVAIEFARHGAQVLIWDIIAEEGEKTISEINALNGQAFYFNVDVSHVEKIDKTYQEIMNRWSKSDILINAAGICNSQPIEDITEEEWDNVLSVNLKGTFFCSKIVMDGMKKQRQGKIINIGSIAGKTGGIPSGAHYAASKAGVMCVTKSFAKTLAPYNIQVNAVAPGVIETDMTRHISGGNWDNFLKQIPLGSIGKVSDIANVIMFLASEGADYITGEIIDINGGQYMD